MAKRRRKKTRGRKKAGASRAAEQPLRQFAGNALRRGKSLDEIMESVERVVLDAALELMKGNRLETAEELGISRSRLYRRMEAVGI